MINNYNLIYILDTLIDKIGRDKFDKYEKYSIWKQSNHILFDEDEEVLELRYEDSLNE